MVRAGLVLVLLFILIGLATTEQIIIRNVYGHMLTETTAIISMVNDYEDTHNPDDFEFGTAVKARVDALYDYWIKRENRMSILIRHIDLAYVADSLIYARNFIHFDNKEEAMAGLARLEYFVRSYKTIFGVNGVNIL